MDQPAKSIPKAAAWMGAAIAAFVVMAVAGRELSSTMGPAQMIAFRNIICLAILSLVMTRIGWKFAGTARPGRHVLRNMVHFFSQFGWFYAIARIPIAEVFAIEFTTPIWTALIAALFLGERLNAARVAAIALGFGGVLVILKPGMEIFNPASLAALAAAFGFAVTHAFTRDLVQTDKAVTVIWWMNLVQLPVALAFALPVWATPGPAQWPWILAMGLTGVGSHYFLSRALQYGEASVVVPIDFLRLPLAAGGTRGAPGGPPPRAPAIPQKCQMRHSSGWFMKRMRPGKRSRSPCAPMTMVSSSSSSST
jgi:drug/metabolite transporter (DMT)-like permease